MRVAGLVREEQVSPGHDLLSEAQLPGREQVSRQGGFRDGCYNRRYPARPDERRARWDEPADGFRERRSIITGNTVLSFVET